MKAGCTSDAGRPHLSVVIPTFNEEARVLRTLEDVDAYLSAQPFCSEILLVDDGSTDRTKSIVGACMATMKRLRLIEGPRNRGKGWAVREGMLKALGAFRIFMDADHSTTIEHWERFDPLMKCGVHVIVGSRVAGGSRIRIRQPPYRRLLGSVFRASVRMLFALPVADTQNGFKAFSAEAAVDVFSRLKTEGWAFDVEVLAIAKRRGFLTLEFPVEWANDERSRLTVAQALRMAVDLLRVAWRVKTVPRRRDDGLMQN